MSRIAIIFTTHDKYGFEETKTLFDICNCTFTYTSLYSDNNHILGGSYYENMAKNLKSSILKLEKTCDTFCIACTSFSLIYDTNFITKEIQEIQDVQDVQDVQIVAPFFKVITMMDAVIMALSCFGKKITILTPYKTDIHNSLICKLSHKFNIVSHNNLNYSTEEEINSIEIMEIEKKIEKLDIVLSDVIFIGCSSVRICRPFIINKLEKKFKKPIVTSMQAFLWSILKHKKYDKLVNNYGILFEKYIN